MTTFYQTEKKCIICGKISRYKETISTSSFGAPDLDKRLPELERSTIDTWIQTCPSCGYCAPDISKRIKKAARVVRTKPYLNQLISPEFPKLANAFLCLLLIQESAGDYASAGWASIHASWACDDAGSDISAKKGRERALTLLQKAIENGQRFDDETGGEEAIVVDLLRRSGQFELALKMCEKGLGKKPEKIIWDILQYQKVLISKSDMDRHTIADAMEHNR